MRRGWLTNIFACASLSRSISGNLLLFPQPVSPHMMVTRFRAIVSSMSERWASMGSWAGTFARAFRSPGGVVGVVGGERPGGAGGAAAGAWRPEWKSNCGRHLTHWLISTQLATSQLATQRMKTGTVVQIPRTVRAHARAEMSK